MKSNYIAVPLLLASALVASAQSVEYLASFGATGYYPYGPFVQGLDGNLYGCTVGGSPYTCEDGESCGTIYKITPSGTLTTVHNFDYADGDFSEGLVLASDGNFYGTTGGGADDHGTAFRLNPVGQLTTLYTFTGDQGSPTDLPLVQAGDGNLYGATEQTIFRLSLTGELTTIYVFSGKFSPFQSSLILGADGNLYGTTSEGGISNNGTIFRLTLSGEFTTIAYFYGPLLEGGPRALVQGASGKLYGVASTEAPGVVFQVSSGGALTVIQTCTSTTCDAPDGVVQGNDGNLYGASYDGGTSGFGSLFEIASSGRYATLFDFDNTSFYNPETPLFQATNGIFYGTTITGGPAGYGNIYELINGLPEFVIPLPTAAEVGDMVRLLGTDLTGAISVSFNGVQTKFKIVSPTQIIADVPAGATTGKIVVIAPIGTLSSNVSFRVAQ